MGVSQDGGTDRDGADLWFLRRAFPVRRASSVASAVRRLTQATRSAEYKQVTVLFADVVRSMDIAATLDIERLREIMTEFVERSAAVVQRYGGTVEHTGDGVMAIFGAPVALEDHAFRACVAALAIRRRPTSWRARCSTAMV